MPTRFQKNLVKGLGISSQGTGKLEDLFQKPPEVRARAVGRLGEVHLDHWKDIADQLVDDDAPRVRIALGRSISVTGSSSTHTLPLAIKLADDNNWRVRLNAVEALRKSENRGALETLFKLIQDKNHEVRLAALRAFNNLCALYPREGAAFQAKVQLPQPRIGAVKVRDVGSPAISIPRKGSAIRGGQPKSSRPGAKSAGKKTSLRLSKTQTKLVEKILDSNPTRVVNAWFANHANPEKPLQFGKEYKLNIEVSPINKAGMLSIKNKDFTEPVGAGEEVLDVVIALVSDDFEFLEKPVKRIKLPRDKSKTSKPVSFLIRPVRSGGLSLSVLFYYRNNLFHEAIIGCNSAIEKDAPARQKRGYLPVENFLGVSSPADLDLNIQMKQVNGKTRLIAFCEAADGKFEIAWCNLPLSATLSEGIAKNAQSILERATDAFLVNGDYRFAETLEKAHRNKRLPIMHETDEETYQLLLRELAIAGRNLLAGLFHPADNEERKDPRISEMESFLKRVARQHSLRIQVLSHDFFLPWNLFYDGEFPAENYKASDFWGFRHQIEEVPRELVDQRIDTISVKGTTNVGLNFNADLPEYTRNPLIAEIKTFGKKILPTERYHERDVLDALIRKDPPLNLEYFICHAETDGIPELRYDASQIILNEQERITLSELNAYALDHQFTSNPFFIINACESAQLDGRFYDGFIHRFLKMGAASVVGTDAGVPGVFAAHFGGELIRALLQGRPIGRALLEIRQGMVEKYKNPLGLLYRVFGSVDAHFAKPLLP